jgi:hypothetical protein
VYVRSYWKRMLRSNSGTRPRLDPRDKRYDVHVNVPGSTPVIVRQSRMPLRSCSHPMV